MGGASLPSRLLTTVEQYDKQISFIQYPRIKDSLK